MTKVWLAYQATGPGKMSVMSCCWATLLTFPRKHLLILLLFMFLQVCASQTIFAEGHSVSVCCIFYLFLHNFLFCLFNLFVFKLARLLFFSRFTFIRSEMTPARAIQQSPSSFLEDSSTSSVHSSSQSLEVEAEREQRRLKCYVFFFSTCFYVTRFWLSICRTFKGYHEAFLLLQIIFCSQLVLSKTIT